MWKHKAFQVIAPLVLLAGAGPAAAADGNAASNGDKAAITQEKAAKIALARVPGGHIEEAELEKEHRRLVWSFDISAPGSDNIREVQVDANTGQVVAEETETPRDEAKESSQNRK
jgi:uncharacterized membrane protein YkoI